MLCPGRGGAAPLHNTFNTSDRKMHSPLTVSLSTNTLKLLNSRAWSCAEMAHGFDKSRVLVLSPILSLCKPGAQCRRCGWRL